MSAIWQIYLWFLIIISFLCGVIMLSLMHHCKYTAKKTTLAERWLNAFQSFFWYFIIVMAVVGVILAILTIW